MIMRVLSEGRSKPGLLNELWPILLGMALTYLIILLVVLWLT